LVKAGHVFLFLEGDSIPQVPFSTGVILVLSVVVVVVVGGGGGGVGAVIPLF
jgi:hypothetical protein